jgi:hypothetical protein
MTTTEWNAKPTAGHEKHGQSAVWNEEGKTIAIVYDGDSHANLIAAAPELLKAIKRAAPWLGKMIADGGHINAVLPNDCVRTLEMVEAAIRKAEDGQ